MCRICRAAICLLWAAATRLLLRLLLVSIVLERIWLLLGWRQLRLANHLVQLQELRGAAVHNLCHAIAHLFARECGLHRLLRLLRLLGLLRLQWIGHQVRQQWWLRLLGANQVFGRPATMEPADKLYIPLIFFFFLAKQFSLMATKYFRILNNE